MSELYDYPDADAIPLGKPTPPHALTREQVEIRVRNLDEAEATVLLDHDAAQRRTIDQQEQEIGRLKSEREDDARYGHFQAQEQNKMITALHKELIVCNQQLTAMTAERDASQGRIRENAQKLIELVGADGPMNLEDVVERVQSQLTASEQEAGESKYNELRESFGAGLISHDTAMGLSKHVQSEYEAAQKRIAELEARVQELSKPLTWTTDRPTVAGWYWWGFPGRGEEVVYIFMAGGKNRKKLYMSYLGLDEAPPLLDHVTGEWAGPIPLPQEGGGRI